MKTLLTSLILTLLSSITLAQTNLAPIKPGIPGKKPGDIIAPMLDEQIAAWCNFNKQIVVTKTNVLCVYNGEQVDSLARSHKNSPKQLAKAKPLPKDLTPTPYEMPEYGDT